MADCGSLQSPRFSYKQLTSSFLSSPRLFTGFVSRGSGDTESSPKSILDTKPYSSLRNPFWSDPNTPNTPKSESRSLWDKLDSKIGLGLVDALVDDKSDSNMFKPDSPRVLFGSQLKIQVPPSAVSPNESPKSPGDFGIKTRSSHIGSVSIALSRLPFKKSPFGSQNFCSLSASEMELSEDYTCVISYGPNPRTTHIFGDCIVDSCCGVVNFSESKKENGFCSDRTMSYPSESFLSFCYNCKNNLGQGKDIYMYRGDKAFCSSECRYEEMMLDEDEDLEASTSL